MLELRTRTCSVSESLLGYCLETFATSSSTHTQTVFLFMKWKCSADCLDFLELLLIRIRSAYLDKLESGLLTLGENIPLEEPK